jgi:hypothetical protein
MSSVETMLRAGMVHRILGSQEGLLEFFFRHMSSELRLEALELRKEARSYLNKSDRILINVALDLWTGERKTRLGDIISDLEFEELTGVIKGIIYHCGIDLRDLDESQC